MPAFIDSILYSYAQIFFGNKRWFGALIMISTFIVPEIGGLALGGVVSNNALAYSLKFDKDKIRNGFYGFNGILFGAAIGFFFELTPFIIFLYFIFLIVVFFISASMEHLLANLFNLPGLSLPFVFTVFIFLIFISNHSGVIYKGISFIDYTSMNFLPEMVQFYLHSIAVILFQPSMISGLIIAVALILFSRVMFVTSIVAFILNYYLLIMIIPDASYEIKLLTSFNSILTAIALGGSLIIVSRKSFFLIIISVLMIIVFTGFFAKLLVNFFLPVLVMPFNFVVLATMYGLKFRQEHSDLVLLYFTPGNPEENFYYHNNRKNRFDKFKFLFPELPVFGEWKISQGFNGEYTHKDDWRYAWDFVLTDKDGAEFRGSGDVLEDYYCYNTPVVSPLEGEIARIIDNVPDNKIGETNLKNNWGNTIIINHGQGLYSALSHLKPHSIKVKKGDFVKKGQVLGLIGNSGRSPYPHLHFQFQLTDKLGEKTYKFPISHFIVQENEQLEVKTFDYPSEETKVRNIEAHNSLKNAFDFQFGSQYKFECSLNGVSFIEEWEVKADIYNNVYIESDNNSKAFIYPKEKVFYFSSFIGNKQSALYYFNLSALSVPLGYSDNIVWEDQHPAAVAINSPVRFISEFFLMFFPQLRSKSYFHIRRKQNGEEKFIIENRLENSGKGIFSFFHQHGEGSIVVDEEGFIKEFFFEINDKQFNAKLIRE